MGEMPRRLGVMGGTFDPIHTGHLLAASEACHTFDLDHVVFIPTGRPWQKSAASVSDPEHRYRMTLLATADNPRFSVSRIDIERAGPTFTADTLSDLAHAHPEADLYFITGADALSGILSWRRHDEVLRLAHLVGVTRPGHQLTAAGLPPESVTLLDIPALAISSTECRARVLDGRPIRYLVPAAVADYIAKYGLYRAT